jgi:hypothetical protein
MRSNTTVLGAHFRNKKVKYSNLSLCSKCTHMEVQFHTFLNSALDVDGWSASRPRRFAFVVRVSS